MYKRDSILAAKKAWGGGDESKWGFEKVFRTWCLLGAPEGWRARRQMARRA